MIRRKFSISLISMIILVHGQLNPTFGAEPFQPPDSDESLDQPDHLDANQGDTLGQGVRAHYPFAPRSNSGQTLAHLHQDHHRGGPGFNHVNDPNQQQRLHGQGHRHLAQGQHDTHGKQFWRYLEPDEPVYPGFYPNQRHHQHHHPYPHLGHHGFFPHHGGISDDPTFQAINSQYHYHIRPKDLFHSGRGGINLERACNCGPGDPRFPSNSPGQTIPLDQVGPHPGSFEYHHHPETLGDGSGSRSWLGLGSPPYTGFGEENHRSGYGAQRSQLRG